MSTVLSFHAEQPIYSGMRVLMFATRPDDRLVRCFAAYEALRDQLNCSDPRSLTPDQLARVQAQFERLAQLNLYREPTDDHTGVDLVLTNENWK
jgi:hypothetical protein